MVNSNWVEIFDLISIEFLVSSSSDNKPLLLTYRKLNTATRKKERIFRYEACSDLDNECGSKVEQIWRSSKHPSNLVSSVIKGLSTGAKEMEFQCF